MLRTILLTGSSSGIGLAITKALTEKGYRVIGLSRRSFVHKNYTHYTADLSQIDQMPDLIKKIRKNHPEIDAVICNAGYGIFSPIEEFSLEAMKQMMDTNFLSHAYLIKEFLPHLKKHKRANIVAIGSVSGLQGKKQGSMYSASKFALRGFMQSIRDECSSNSVSTTIVEPGYVRTAFFDQLSFTPGNEDHQAILPEDIAYTIEMILSLRSETVIDEIIMTPSQSVFAKKREQQPCLLSTSSS